jgi:hypothetical protein
LAGVINKTRLYGILDTSFFNSFSLVKPFEAMFWDRLFLDFLDKTNDPKEACIALVHHLSRRERKNNLIKIEFGGCLAPIKEIENMSFENFEKFFVLHAKSNFGPDRKSFKVKNSELNQVSGDLFNISRLYNLPLTLLVFLSHDNYDRKLTLPKTLPLYGSVMPLYGLLFANSKYWAEGNPPLCDLDMALCSRLREKDRAMFTQSLLKKKQAILGSLRKQTANGFNLLALPN